MNKIIKYSVLIILIFALLLMITGCGNIASKNELISFARKNYGEADCMDYIQNEEYSRATFKDREFGFTYTITSYKEKMLVDGTNFGSYENKSSTFTQEYIEAIKNKTKDKLEQISANIEWNKYYSEKPYDDCLIYVYLKNESECQEKISKAGKIIDDADKRNFLDNAIVYGKYNNEIVGEYVLRENKYKSSSEDETEKIMNDAFTIMKLNYDIKIKDEKELTYLKTETMDIEDIPGLNPEERAYRITDTTESLKNVKVFYYKYKGETWIIADTLVVGGRRHVYKLSSNE